MNLQVLQLPECPVTVGASQGSLLRVYGQVVEQGHLGVEPVTAATAEAGETGAVGPVEVDTSYVLLEGASGRVTGGAAAARADELMPWRFVRCDVEIQFVFVDERGSANVAIVLVCNSKFYSM